MKQVAVVLVVFFISLQAKAQVEIKFNTLPVLLSKRGEVSAELIVFKRFGVEAGAGLAWHRSSFAPVFDTTNMAPKEKSVYRQTIYFLGGKYYFSNVKNGYGFYLGAMYQHQFYSFYEKNDQPAPKPAAKNALGIEPGYKWIIKDHLSLDVGMRWLYAKYTSKLSTQNDAVFDVDLVINGKIG
ncbi:MAG: DUF3575 domain-containing protein [Saprospiraceae bacterium]